LRSFRGGVVALNRFGFTLADVEREHSLDTLACCHGNRTRAAKLLDISIRCLRMKLRHFDSGRDVVAETEIGRALLCSADAAPGGIMTATKIGTLQ
jgi:hypothetical protein